MQLFHNNANTLSPIERNSFKLERDIQSLVETNMEVIFGIEFVSTELTVGEFRLDSLAFDQQNNSFIIVEYKKGHSYSVVDQGYSYLSTMLNNKAEFILEYNEKNEKQLKKSDIDWTSSRVIFVSPSFNSYQKNSVNFLDVPFELWEVKRFNGNLVSFERHVSSSNESIEKLSKNVDRSVISKVSSEIKIRSEEDHVQNLTDSIKPIWETLRERLCGFADTSFSVQKGYISWKRDNTAICFIHFPKKELRIDVLRGNIKEDQTKSKGFFTFKDDPKNITEERSWKWKSGQTGHDYKIRLRHQDDIDYMMFLLEQKYNSLG
jgi:predicted transport protein